jgi:hypothetical protein
VITQPSYFQAQQAHHSPPSVHRFRDVWLRPKIESLSISAVALFLEFGFEVGMAFATAAVLKRRDIASDVLTDVRLLLVKPRAAPFIGILGLLHERWLEDAVDSLIVDGIMSWIAAPAFSNTIYYFGDVGNHFQRTLNPARPSGALVMFIGAILLSVPTYVVAFIFVIVMFVVGGCIYSFVIMAVAYLAAAVFIFCLPFIASYEAFQKKVMGNDIRWPLIGKLKLGKKCYLFFLLSSFVINVGNWLTFSEFFILSGDLWCPGDLSDVTVFWWIFPFLVHIVLAWYRSSMKDLRGLLGSIIRLREIRKGKA